MTPDLGFVFLPVRSQDSQRNFHDPACRHALPHYLPFSFKDPPYSSSSRQPSLVSPVFQELAMPIILEPCWLTLCLCSVYISEIVWVPGFPILCSDPSAHGKAVGLSKCGCKGEEGPTEDFVFPRVSPEPRPLIFLPFFLPYHPLGAYPESYMVFPTFFYKGGMFLPL